jgi:hypothetical protein
MEENPFCDVVFSGHSFGAAMATIAPQKAANSDTCTTTTTTTTNYTATKTYPPLLLEDRTHKRNETSNSPLRRQTNNETESIIIKTTNHSNNHQHNTSFPDHQTLPVDWNEQNPRSAQLPGSSSGGNHYIAPRQQSLQILNNNHNNHNHNLLSRAKTLEILQDLGSTDRYNGAKLFSSNSKNTNYSTPELYWYDYRRRRQGLLDHENAGISIGQK